jgi:hypothetical protein
VSVFSFLLDGNKNGGSLKMGSFIICTHHQENEVDRACGRHRRGKKIVQGFGEKA